MPELAACYFCGAALDESLSTVRLGDAPDATTVTLCEGCKEKLQTVLEAVDTGGASRTPPESAHDEPNTAAESDGASGDPRESTEAEELSDDVDASSAEVASVPDDGDDASVPADGPADPAAGDPTESAGGNAGERSIVEGDQEISALEYNKVMRLLQNREFPVDRGEIVTVAANAYQVSRADCDRVIDAAIDRGLFDEEDGQLVRPD